MAPGVEILFLRHDGAQLAMRRGEILERVSTESPWTLLEVAEGSPLYRRRRVIAIAEAHGYIAADPVSGKVVSEPRSARGQLGGSRHKRVQVTVETPDTEGGRRFRAQVLGGDGTWHSADELAAALAGATGVPLDDEDLAGLAARIDAKLAQPAASA